MAVTFPVSAVEPAREPLETVGAEMALHNLLTRPETLFEEPWVRYPPLEPCEAYGAPGSSFVSTAIHPVVGAALLAFDSHRPLSLSPDHVWVLVMQGVAEHLRQNAELLRGRLVGHEGTLLLDVRRDDFVKGQENDWAAAVNALAAQIREHVGGRHDLMVSDFTTTGPLELTASQIVMLDALSSYFELQITSVCGIPSITLEGTPEDWRSIRRRVSFLRDLELDFWLDALEPGLDRFVAASEGRHEDGRWESFFKLNSQSGGPYVTGWINVFLPFVHERERGSVVRNPRLESWEAGLDEMFGGGPTTDVLPPSLSAVPFTWRYLAERLSMELLGGFVGVSQDAATLTLRPELGWAVRARPRPS